AVGDEAGFGRSPPCADPGFDHRTCDFWEDDRRGSKASRLAWLEATPPPAPEPDRSVNPFAPTRGPAFNPFDPRAGAAHRAPMNPFGDDDDDEPVDNPFAPPRERGPAGAA